MVRAEKARSDNNDEIPVARRVNAPIRVKAGLPTLLIILSIGLVGFITTFVFVKRSLDTRSLEVRQYLRTNPSSDGRLIGHFPYKEASPKDLETIRPGIQVNSETAKYLRRMIRAAASDGVYLALLSGYRSHDLQKEIFFEVKSERNQTATERAKVSAPPGYSEHSTGYAIDLGDVGRPETHFEVDFETTWAFRWLKKNAAKYHFVLSFPKGNAQGVSYEPWHWRFEGSAEALREFEESRKFSESKK